MPTLRHVRGKWYRVRPPRFVQGRKESGCVAACLAMLAGISLEEAASLLPGPTESRVLDLERALRRYGWELGDNVLCWDRLPGPRERALMTIVSLGNRPLHAIVTPGNGQVYDPARRAPTPGAKYGAYLHKVGQLAAWWWPVVPARRMRRNG